MMAVNTTKLRKYEHGTKILCNDELRKWAQIASENLSNN
jgi:hypothetical protein